MESQRQTVFQKLRPACVTLSSVGLRFKAGQVSVREVLLAIEEQNRVLRELGDENQLDANLAEYAFIPLTHVLKESKKLSPRCLEVIVQSITIIVGQGWRAKLAPTMGEQLLMFTSLLAGGHPQAQTESPTDDLKVAAFGCIAAVSKWLTASPSGSTVLQGSGTKNIVDQLVYILCDGISESPSDGVQIAAAEALLQLNESIRNRVFLASLLPRTVSSLTKALRPSTQARRTYKVLVTDLDLLRTAILAVLSDDIAPTDKTEMETLNDSWLKATTAQVKTALTQVMKLRNHDRIEVRRSLASVCSSLIELCGKNLAATVPVLLETLVVLSDPSENNMRSSPLKHLISTRPELVDILQSSFFDWTQTLPRIMQGHDDRPKEVTLARIVNSFNILQETTGISDSLIDKLTSTLLDSVAGTIEANQKKDIQVITSTNGSPLTVFETSSRDAPYFEPVLFNHQSQQESVHQLTRLIGELRKHPAAGQITRRVVDVVAQSQMHNMIAPTWLAIQLLRQPQTSSFSIDDLIAVDDSLADRVTSHAYLVHDLYSSTKDILLDSSPYSTDGLDQDWRMTALSLESLVLQAQSLGQEYRTELYETLYPVLALFSSQNSQLQAHAVTALNMLSSACKCDNAAAMLMENVDYLVNSIAWKLNTFNLSPEAPQVLRMVVRLVGAKLIPYLDDLVASIFTALDTYHGYPAWVELLFESLQTIVEESTKDPGSVIAGARTPSSLPSIQSDHSVSTVDDILSDVRARKKRKQSRSENIEERAPAPHRPWTKKDDDPTFNDRDEIDVDGPLLDLDKIIEEANEGPLPPPSGGNNDKRQEDDDPMKPASISHALLLKIARAAIPHLSSPSPKVRHLLLQLLTQVCPLLAQHENSFLPLVNDIWPAVVQRLFADGSIADSNQSSSKLIIHNETILEDDNTDKETSYNIAAAADLMTKIFEGARDFMASRLETIFPQLQLLFSRLYNDVEKKIAAAENRGRDVRGQISGIHTLPATNSQPNIRGTVDLNIISTKPPSPNTFTQPNKPNSTTKSSSSSLSTTTVSTYPSRTPTTQILTSLLHLLISILTSIPPSHMNPDTTDQIFEMLTPFITTLANPPLSTHDTSESASINTNNMKRTFLSLTLHEKILAAMNNVNEDAVWLILQTTTTS